MAPSLVQPENVSPNADEDIKASYDIPIPFSRLPALYNWPVSDEEGYSINEVPSGTGRRLKVICAGAGASGINLAKFVKDKLQNVELTVYEKNSGVAGTWFESRYP